MAFRYNLLLYQYSLGMFLCGLDGVVLSATFQDDSAVKFRMGIMASVAQLAGLYFIDLYRYKYSHRVIAHTCSVLFTLSVILGLIAEETNNPWLGYISRFFLSGTVLIMAPLLSSLGTGFVNGNRPSHLSLIWPFGSFFANTMLMCFDRDVKKLLVVELLIGVHIYWITRLEARPDALSYLISNEKLPEDHPYQEVIKGITDGGKTNEPLDGELMERSKDCQPEIAHLRNFKDPAFWLAGLFCFSPSFKHLLSENPEYPTDWPLSYKIMAEFWSFSCVWISFQFKEKLGGMVRCMLLALALRSLINWIQNQGLDFMSLSCKTTQAQDLWAPICNATSPETSILEFMQSTAFLVGSSLLFPSVLAVAPENKACACMNIMKYSGPVIGLIRNVLPKFVQEYVDNNYLMAFTLAFGYQTLIVPHSTTLEGLEGVF